MSTMTTQLQNLRDHQLAGQLAESAALNPEAPQFPDHDKALAAEVKKITEASEERARLRSADAKEQYDAQVQANVLRARERVEEKRGEIDRYHATQQARDQKAEAEVARRFKYLAETQQGPENVWTMSVERQKYLAQTVEMAKPFLSAEQIDALNASVDPSYVPANPLPSTEGLPRLPQREQPREQTQERPATFADGKYSHITDNGDGTVLVELPTGERYKGNWQEVAELQAKSIVHTKLWGRKQREQAQSQPAVAGLDRSLQLQEQPYQEQNPELSQSELWQAQQDYAERERIAKVLGYSNFPEMERDAQLLRETRAQIDEQRMLGEFFQKAPDFPGTQAASEAVVQIVENNGWKMSADSLNAAHLLAVRNGAYKPIPVEQEIASTPHRPTPPPMPSGQSPDNGRQEPNLWTEDMAEQRKRIIREQLLEKGRI
jgi:hypothetical protein